MGDRLKGKVAIVTGAGRGLGRAEALALASEGARVVVNNRIGAPDPEGNISPGSPADEVVAEIRRLGGEAVANHDSVATWQGGENIIKAAIDAFGRLDILVNNAGILRTRLIFDMSEDDWDAVQKVHLYGTFYTTRHACVLFRQQMSGCIINTSSTIGLGSNLLGQSNYGAAKEGIIGFTRNIAREMGPYGVRCNAIRPAAGTRLNMTGDVGRAMSKESIERLQNTRPEDVAPLVVWLASDAAANVNGRTLFVSTGRIALYSEPEEERQWVKAGSWTIDEIFKFMPATVARGLTNPTPPQTPGG